MDEFLVWFETGLGHIANLSALDHILFVCLLTQLFDVKEWKKLAWLITWFTVGHAVSLAISIWLQTGIDTTFVELLIAISILVTAAFQIWSQWAKKKATTLIYMMMSFFGLIHGLGFSFVLRSLLGDGQNILIPLFSFNIGVEIGQLILAGIFLLINCIMYALLKEKDFIFRISLSFGIGVVALIMCADRIGVLIGQSN